MRSEKLAYSSVTGLFHQREDIPNQDAYIAKKYNFGTVLVVADGIGSQNHSDIGSQRACKAVCDAVRKWQKYDKKDIRLLIPLIHSIWNMEVYPYSRNECDTTCLFAFVSRDERLYVAQLGDGNIYVSVDNKTELLHTKEDEFSNFTSGLGNIVNFSEWTIKEYDIKDKNVELMLMTDGVSETLIEEKKEMFVELLWKKLRESKCLYKRNNILFSVLRNWNTMHIGDDRTIVCYGRYRRCGYRRKRK